MAKLETWNLDDDHPYRDKGREWARAGYFGDLNSRPSLFGGSSTPQNVLQAINRPDAAGGSYARDVLTNANKNALKPEGDGWVVTGYKEIAPARAATKWHGGYKAGAAYMTQPARAAITVPIYARAVTPPPAPTPSSEPRAPKEPPPPGVDVAGPSLADALGQQRQARERPRLQDALNSALRVNDREPADWRSADAGDAAERSDDEAGDRRRRRFAASPEWRKQYQSARKRVEGPAASFA